MLSQPKQLLQISVAQQRHVCIVTETYPPEVNGVAITLARLVEGLRDQGVRVSVVRPRRSQSDKSNSDDLLVGGLSLPGYPGLRMGLPAHRALRNHWQRRCPDAVYVATEGLLGWSALHTARKLRIPVFSGFHTNFHSYSKHYHAGWLDPFILGYLRWFHNRSTATIVASAQLAHQLRHVGVENIRVLGRGVDSRLFNPNRRSAELRRRWGVCSNDLVALYVGRLAPEKNLDLAIRAYRAMQNSGNAARMVLVGDGPLRAPLEANNRDLIFLGLQTGNELARCYASADIFLFPSETETFGNVTLEALASGLLVVAYDYAAAHVHIRDGESGVLVPRGDSESFVAASVRLARARQYHLMIRRLARESAAALDWQRIVQRFALLLGLTQSSMAVSEEVLPQPHEPVLEAM
jgi:glycosyltransferase involved in cell wall biosynthesis